MKEQSIVLQEVVFKFFFFKLDDLQKWMPCFGSILSLILCLLSAK